MTRLLDDWPVAMIAMTNREKMLNTGVAPWWSVLSNSRSATQLKDGCQTPD